MTRHALDCGVCCGLAACDCGAESVPVPRKTLEEAIELLSNPKWTLNRAGVVVTLRRLLAGSKE